MAEIDRLAKNLAKLVEIFRQGGKASDFQWWGENSPLSIFNPNDGYQDGQPLFEEVVQKIIALNPKMLSEHEVQTKITYDFLMRQTANWTEPDHLNNQSLINEAKHHLKELIEFEAWQDVDIAMAYMHLGDEPFTLGRVSFVKVANDELEKWRKQGYWPTPELRVITAARVKSPGDEQKAIGYARREVSVVLNVLRAFCVPFGIKSDMWLASPVGEMNVSRLTPVRIDGKKFLTLVGPGIVTFDFQKDTARLEAREWELLNRLILKSPQVQTDMEKKLMGTTHWLAEATKPDTNNSKFTKISIALETLLGEEPKDEDLKVRGITAMLAERAAFIAGTDLDDKHAIDRDVRRYYGMRSNVLHGRKGDVSLDDIDGFGKLVRRLALALLEKLDELANELSNVEKLEKWVKEQKYTLPEGGA